MAVRLKGKAWKKRCEEVWERDYGACVLRIDGEPHKGCLGQGTTPPHHIRSKKMGGGERDDSMGNLATLCINGHLAAHGEGNFPETQEEIREVLLKYTGGV